MKVRKVFLIVNVLLIILLLFLATTGAQAAAVTEGLNEPSVGVFALMGIIVMLLIILQNWWVKHSSRITNIAPHFLFKIVTSLYSLFGGFIALVIATTNGVTFTGACIATAAACMIIFNIFALDNKKFFYLSAMFYIGSMAWIAWTV